MNLLITLSLLLNIVVLIPVCTSLISNADWLESAFGTAGPARGILLSIYIAIGLVSALLLFMPQPAFVASLLLVQVVYKVTTPFTVGTLRNPVVISNLGIAAFHMLTLMVLAPVVMG